MLDSHKKKRIVSSERLMNSSTHSVWGWSVGCTTQTGYFRIRVPDSGKPRPRQSKINPGWVQIWVFGPESDKNYLSLPGVSLSLCKLIWCALLPSKAIEKRSVSAKVAIKFSSIEWQTLIRPWSDRNLNPDCPKVIRILSDPHFPDQSFDSP